ncbi:hypothetical protein SCUCBS95973_007885 [Sporothrix curviconia]|uniref:Ubiquitin-like protease family profile domain-containing protein n=1 Tax=Sporothrix curviconia TaxID=1260050 RepID=A0ABP0CH26_9PEZI
MACPLRPGNELEEGEIPEHEASTGYDRDNDSSTTPSPYFPTLPSAAGAVPMIWRMMHANPKNVDPDAYLPDLHRPAPTLPSVLPSFKRYSSAGSSASSASSTSTSTTSTAPKTSKRLREVSRDGDHDGARPSKVRRTPSADTDTPKGAKMAKDAVEPEKARKSRKLVDGDDLPLVLVLKIAEKRAVSPVSNYEDSSSSASFTADSPFSAHPSPLSSPATTPPSSPVAPPSVYDAFEQEQLVCLQQAKALPGGFSKPEQACMRFMGKNEFPKTETPFLTVAQRSVIVSSSASASSASASGLSSASCLECHPHALDKAAHKGDHLLVHPRPVNPRTGKYVGVRKPALPLDTPRGKLSRDVCPHAQPLDCAGEAWVMTAGKLVSERQAAINATADPMLRQAKLEYRNTQLTYAQNSHRTYLSYHAVTLTNEDVRVLRNGWLTDNNITFWEEYLEREVLPKYPQARICLLRASITLILMASESIDVARKALPDFRTTTHIFMPISDAKDLSRSESGSHWSLLLVSVIDGVAFHYDSMGTSNLREARNVTARMAVLLGRHLRFRHIDDTPQQDNGNDCGVFVCVLMRFLLVKRLLNAHAREKVSMSLGGKMIDAQGGRKEMLRIIENLRREGERRRSTSPFVKKDVPRIE